MQYHESFTCLETVNDHWPDYDHFLGIDSISKDLGRREAINDVLKKEVEHDHPSNRSKSSLIVSKPK